MALLTKWLLLRSFVALQLSDRLKVFHLSFSDPSNASTTPSSGNARVQHVRKKMELCNTLIANGLECIKSSNLDTPASERKRFSNSAETGIEIEGTELPDLAEMTESLGQGKLQTNPFFFDKISFKRWSSGRANCI